MRYLKYLALLAFIAIPAIHSQAQVSVGVYIGPEYGYYNPEPVCPYGYYPYYPFACTPYGYWGPQWFAGDVFIGAGPWYHYYYRYPQFYRRGHWEGFERFHGDRDFHRFHEFRGEERGFDRDRGFRGGERRFEGGHEFHGGDRGFEGRFRGGEGFHGDRGFHGGRESHGGGGFRAGNGGFHGGRGSHSEGHGGRR